MIHIGFTSNDTVPDIYHIPVTKKKELIEYG